MPIVFEEFSSERITLMREVNRHPELMENIAAQYNVNDSTDWGGVVGEIASYVNVAMNGDYYPLELDKIYIDIYFKLRYKRQRRGG